MAQSRAKTTRPKRPAAPRRLKQSQYKTFHLNKRIKHPAPRLPSSFTLLRRSFKQLGDHPRIIIGILLVYAVLTLMLVHGIGGGLNLPELKSNFQQLFQGHQNQLTTGVTLFGLLIGTAGSGGTPTAGLYQSILLILFSLVFIWSLRQLQAGQKVGLREAFYKSTYPLIPFLLVLLVIGLELIPLLLGSSIYAIVISNSIAVTFLERTLWGLLFGGFVLLSLYMMSSSLFALYIVTLPDMTPLRALRSARELVRFRRWSVLRKIIALPLLLLILAAIVVIPFILVFTAVAATVFFICSVLAVAIVHAYMYSLYRELL
jgi:hypothetical protein